MNKNPVLTLCSIALALLVSASPALAGSPGGASGAETIDLPRLSWTIVPGWIREAAAWLSENLVPREQESAIASARGADGGQDSENAPSEPPIGVTPMLGQSGDPDG